MNHVIAVDTRKKLMIVGTSGLSGLMIYSSFAVWTIPVNFLPERTAV